MNQIPQLIVTPRDTADGFDRIDIDLPDNRVGQVRCRFMGDKVIIYSIQIFPEFQGNAYGRVAVDDLKRRFRILIADRVRYTARAFWEKMGFVQLPDDDKFEHQWSWTARQPKK